jgi:hypothetical protein
MSEVKYRTDSYPGGYPEVPFATPPGPSIFTPVNSVSDILTSIDGQYTVVRSFDINGGHTYDPAVPDFINTLDYMGPGYGYQIKMSEDGILDWSVAGIMGSTSMMKYKSKRVFYQAASDVSHFTPVAQTATWMDLWDTFTINDIDAEVGDEVGVFVDDDCFGAYKVDDPGWYGFLPVYGDDPNTPEKDGADPGDLLTIKIWDSSEGVERTLSTDEYTGSDPLTWTDGITVQVDIAAILGECGSDEDCGICEKCEEGMCIFQKDLEDIKDECTDETCATGLCDGNGECGVEPDGTECDDGLYCTKVDECQGGRCLGSDDPCTDDGLYCEEDSDQCVMSDVTIEVGKTGGYPGRDGNPVEVRLDNPIHLVSAVEFDICDEGDYLTCTGCETTERTSDFNCDTNEFEENGCCRVVLVSESGDLIEEGTGPIFILKYYVKEEMPPVCVNLNPENIVVVDNYDSPEELWVLPVPGEFCDEHEGDFDHNNNVDGSDFFISTENFGRN